MKNLYVIDFEADVVAYRYSLKEAKEVALEILNTIKQNDKIYAKDDYQLIQISKYHWFFNLFKIKPHRLILWSEKENKFLTLKG